MSFQKNINHINYELKKNFNISEVDTSNHRFVKFTLSKPIMENVSEALQMKVVVKTNNLTNMNPVIEWSYSDNPINEKNYIGYRTGINQIAPAIADIIKEGKMDKEYLSSLKVEMINEDVETEETEVINLEDTYEVDGDNTKINLSKYFQHIEESLGVILEFKKSDYFKENRERVGNTFNETPKMGDRLEVIMNVTNEKLTPNTWMKLEECLMKLPSIDDVYINTSKNEMVFDFNTTSFVELI